MSPEKDDNGLVRGSDSNETHGRLYKRIRGSMEGMNSSMNPGFDACVNKIIDSRDADEAQAQFRMARDILSEMDAKFERRVKRLATVFILVVISGIALLAGAFVGQVSREKRDKADSTTTAPRKFSIEPYSIR